MPLTYRDVARQLPVPTAEQALAFARYVAGAHSWYKHLSALKASPFKCFLDANAGRALVRTSSGLATYADITDESESFHYNWQTTVAWRTRFGLWNYRRPAGTSFRLPSPTGIWELGKVELQILGPDGERFPVDAELVEAGTAGLTALVHTSGSLDRAQMAGEDDHTGLIQSLFSRDQTGEGKYLGPAADAVLAQLPAAVASAVREAVPLWLEQDAESAARYLQNPNRQAERWAARRRDEGVEPDPPKDARELALTAALAADRERQIAELVAAMARFVATLHAPAAG